MKNTISIRELNDFESKKILKDEKFSKLKPVSCSQGGKETGFRKKLFQIKGVPESKQSEPNKRMEMGWEKLALFFRGFLPKKCFIHQVRGILSPSIHPDRSAGRIKTYTKH